MKKLNFIEVKLIIISMLHIELSSKYFCRLSIIYIFSNTIATLFISGIPLFIKSYLNLRVTGKFYLLRKIMN